MEQKKGPRVKKIKVKEEKTPTETFGRKIKLEVDERRGKKAELRPWRL